MKILSRATTVEDLDSFLAAIEKIGEETGATIQCFDADYVASDRHLRRAVDLAARAREQETAIADDPAVEILLYAAGRRQINRALEMGVEAGSTDVVAVVTGGDEAAAKSRVAELLGGNSESVTLGDNSTMQAFFDIGDRELRVVDGEIEHVVLERVALLDVEK